MPQNNQTLLEKTVADQWQTLPSGLTVLVRPMPGYSSTHVIYATKFGSIDRDFCLNGQTVHLPAGVAHFLEHKMFEDEDGDACAKYAKTGANANAFTSFDRTCYLFTATQQLDESLDVLLGMVGHPYFTEQTIAKEQGIIGQEIKMYDDSPDWRLITGLFECLYHSHPIRSDIAGTVESIAEITPAMLYDSCKAFYAPGNMVLAAAGNTTMEQILAACKRHGLMEPRPAQKVQRLWYYFMEDGTEKVYTVSADLISEMVWQLADVAEKDSFVTVTSDNFVKETVTKPGDEVKTYEADNEDQEDTVTSIMTALSGFYFTDCADYHVTDATLGNYGLAEDQRTKVELTYKDTSDDDKEKTVTFYVGSKDDSATYYYVQMDGSQRVSRVLIDTVEKALGWKVDSSAE